MTLIEFREPQEEDVTALIEIALTHRETFLEDGATLDGETFALPELYRKATLVFTAPTEEGRIPIGSVDFTDINSDLSAILHFTLRPHFLKTFLREKTYLDALLDRFRTLNVRKFTVIVPDFNRVAQKMAEKMGFQFVATFPSEVYYRGLPNDVHFYSMTRKDLSKALAKHFIEQEQEVPVPLRLAKPKTQRKRRVKQQSSEQSAI